MTALAPSLAGSPGLTLAEIAALLAARHAVLTGAADVRLTGVSQDSRRVAPGDLFCARSGGKTSGLLHAAEAVRRGARAVLCAQGEAVPELGVPVIRVDDPQRALSFVAEAVYGYPTRALPLVGITGTNGKTTVSFLIEHALAELGARPARLGTLGLSFGGRDAPGALTTPEADELSRTFAGVRAEGASHLVMEVSSHALELGRVAALAYRVAAFTNLTQDHLDFHADMAAYGAAKARLFTEFALEASVINTADPFGRALAERARGRVIGVARAGQAEIAPREVASSARGVELRVALPGAEVTLASGLVGDHNVENLLVALGVLVALGYDPARAALALGRAPQVSGRLERCDEAADDVRVFVDYAHTPDALARVLAALRGASSGELACVFGCGGDRDPSKRPKMGEAVARGADRAYLTNDNPRTEDPARIAAAIEPPLRASGIPYAVELDRRTAIERAVLEAPPGATVLLAGKGHEPYQIIGAEQRPFDDRAEARRALALRRKGQRP